MHAAQQLIGRAVGTAQYVGNGRDMTRLSGVAGTQYGDLRWRQAESPDAAAGDKGKRLQRLQARCASSSR